MAHGLHCMQKSNQHTTNLTTWPYTWLSLHAARVRWLANLWRHNPYRKRRFRVHWLVTSEKKHHAFMNGRSRVDQSLLVTSFSPTPPLTNRKRIRHFPTRLWPDSWKIKGRFVNFSIVCCIDSVTDLTYVIELLIVFSYFEFFFLGLQRPTCATARTHKDKTKNTCRLFKTSFQDNIILDALFVIVSIATVCIIFYLNMNFTLWSSEYMS